MSITEAAFHDYGIVSVSKNGKLTHSAAPKSSVRTEVFPGKLSWLLGNHCHGLRHLDAVGLRNDKFTSVTCHLPLRACSGNMERKDGAVYSTSKEKPWPLRRFQMQLMHVFDDLGIGGSNFVEGTIGLMLVAGPLLMAAKLMWQKGSQLRSEPRKYRAVIEFPLASGITVGTPVRVRGVDVGAVIKVRPSLEKIDASIQVMDSSVIIPRNALVEVNQSGLLSETLIDITPMYPVPHILVGPLDPSCPAAGLIVCDKERIRGKQGVSLDELVRLCGKMAIRMNDSGVSELLNTADQIGVVLDNTKPLLDKIETFVENIEPLMKELEDGMVLKDLTQQVKLATHAAYELRSSSGTPENLRLFHDSVTTLTRTLKDFESATADMSSLIGNDKTRNNLKQLIESLSRLVND